MAKAKKEEVQEEVQETKTAKKKPAVKEVEQPDNVEVTGEPVEANEITTGTIKVGGLTINDEGIKYESANDEAPQPIERQTPFGVEVWDPIEKRTVLKDA
ncbi:hypothetical protein [Enterococcus faecalis]|uniref:hypothetical protein n=1 Tax=Enterococcus faecalis TaxID=1351 RepID=UPI001E4E5BD2|nr:hypothetical protein [Enterococcus faecalis]MCD5170690.1 hypothetical protein [Enterococcus faecalis]MCD5261254.1 hypothetical protein [Enterococcus faecalis]MCV6009449.1 hypothetical protein [Enterococcus faecalis]